MFLFVSKHKMSYTILIGYIKGMWYYGLYNTSKKKTCMFQFFYVHILHGLNMYIKN